MFIARSFLSERVQMNAGWMGTRSLDRDRYWKRRRTNNDQPSTNPMLVKVYGCAVFGINATIVTAEVNVENGAFFQTRWPAG